MNASCLLDACRAAGLSLEAEGEDLFIETDRDPPAALLDELKLHKAEIVALLREPVAAGLQEGDLAVSGTRARRLLSEAAQNPPRALTARFPDSPARESTESITTIQAEDTDHSLVDWRDLYEERSAIRQYDGHYSRAEAEALAWGEVQNRWHMEHGERVSRDICAGCRRPIESATALDLIDGSRIHLDDGHACLIRHGERWRAAATRDLITLGLRPPVTGDVALPLLTPMCEASPTSPRNTPGLGEALSLEAVADTMTGVPLVSDETPCR